MIRAKLTTIFQNYASTIKNLSICLWPVDMQGYFLWYTSENINTAPYLIVVVISVSKIRINIYRSDIQLIFQLYGISYVYRSFVWNKTTFIKYCLTQWNSKLPRSFEIHKVRQYLFDFMGLVGRVNATVYKTKPIFTGLRHGKLSWFFATVISSVVTPTNCCSYITSCYCI